MHYLYNQKVHYHADLLELLKLELKTLPEGSMKSSKGKFLCQVVKGKEVGITNNEELIIQYCRKALVTLLIKHLEKSQKLPAHLHKALSIKEIIALLPASYQGFPLHYYFHSQYSDWLGLKSSPAKFHSKYKKYPTSNDTFVRSKSELIIASLLEAYKIPFLYEALFQAEGKSIYPDFLIFCPYTGRLIIKEHFGALHQKGYEKGMRDKIVLYHQLGFKLFETVIYTFESDISEPRHIHEIIEKIILNPQF